MRLLLIIIVLSVLLNLCDCRALERRSPASTISPASSVQECSSSEEQSSQRSSQQTCQQSDLHDQSTSLDDDADNNDNSEEEAERCRLLLDRFPDPIPRPRLLQILKRAVELIEHPDITPARKRQCMMQDVDQDAKNILKLFSGDPDIGLTTDDGSRSASASQEVQPFYPSDVLIDNTKRVISQSTMENILSLHQQGQSEKSIRGKYRWYNRQYLVRFQQRLNSGSRRDQQQEIDRSVAERVNEAIDSRLPVHDYNIKYWALDRASELGLHDFMASHYWIMKFKELNGFTSRAVTGYESRAQAARREQIERSRESFYENYMSLRDLFPYRLIFNVDQSGFNYEVSNKRTIARKGDRDVTLRIESKNKNTHSNTVQAMIARDGTLAGKLMLCLREDTDNFGPRVNVSVRQVESELGNVFVTASRSGKMTTRLIHRWIENVLLPEMRSRLEHDTIESEDGTEIISQHEPQAEPSWASDPDITLTQEQRRILEIRNSSSTYVRRPDLMLLADSWTGHSSDDTADFLGNRGVFELRIPEHTTG